MRSTMPSPTVSVTESFTDSPIAQERTPASPAVLQPPPAPANAYCHRLPTANAELCSETSSTDAIASEIDTALARSEFPLQDVSCRCDGHHLILTGQARRYFHVQVALTLAMALAGRHRVISEIEVRH